MATWNIRGLNGKEHELVNEVKRAKIDLIGITETKRKGQGELRIDDYVLLYSGVNVNARASGGVGVLFHESIAEVIRDWKFLSERLMTLDIEEGNILRTIVVAYGPNDCASSAAKEEFFENLQRTVDDAAGEVIIMGDLNGRVERDKNRWPEILGNSGELDYNDNGERILQFCAANGLVVANSFFPHKEAHLFTREEQSKNERSIIDYFLLKREMLREIMGVRVKQGYEIC